jgi:hypothetical protein
MSDDPGSYEEEQLRELLVRYLSQELVTAQRIRDVLLPACLERDHITRDELKREFVRRNVVSDPSKAGYVLTVLSSQVGMQKNDFLRQVIGYEYPNYTWEKDNYFICPEHKQLVKEVLATLNSNRSENQQTPAANAPAPDA